LNKNLLLFQIDLIYFSEPQHSGISSSRCQEDEDSEDEDSDNQEAAHSDAENDDGTNETVDSNLTYFLLLIFIFSILESKNVVINGFRTCGRNSF